VPLLVEPGAENFHRFMDALLARPWMDFAGLSVTIPHKENALAYLGPECCDPLAVRIGAINTITIGPGGTLRGDNTDYAAAIEALCQAMGIGREGLAGRSVAVLGAGGAARAIVAALTHYRAHVTVYNRTLPRAQSLADEFKSARASPLAASPAAAPLAKAADGESEIIINCTPIGMHPNVDASPLERIPAAARVVFDTIYNPPRTRLLQQARQAGCVTIAGLEMFLHQAAAQFHIWTHMDPPLEVMGKACSL
jgi:3-dehydroquinate dehydratase/shikimate dehydrogenase